MAKIAIDARELTSSTGRYVERLLHYLQEIDKTNSYIVLLRPQDMGEWRASNANFSSVACPYKEFSLSEQIGYRHFLKKLDVDLVHFAMVQQPLLYFGKHVTTMHDLTTTRFTNPAKNKVVYFFKQQVYKFVNWYVPRSSKIIITPTEFVKKDVLQFSKIKESKIVVTYEAADEIHEAIEPIKSLQSRPFIFYVGRPQPHKNLGRLIEAFSVVKKSQPDLLLVLAGRKDKVYDSFISETQRLGIEDSVIFTGYVTEGQLKWLYRGCKAYIFPSLSEGFGLPGLEAMTHHAPVVCSDATCLPEVYGDAAWYFNPLDVHDIARSINEVLQNTELRKDLIRRGVKQAAKYSWKKMAEETLAVYEKALKN
jgi:glycosyltransferase involved in cell wall biosynthesis